MRVLSVLCCWAALLAPASGQETPPVPQPEVVASEADRAREERLRRGFAQVPALRGVTVTVVADVVTLAGEAESAAAARQAVEIARKLDAVLWVEDRIRIRAEAAAAAEPGAPTPEDEQLRRRLLAVLGQVQELRGLEVQVHAGVVQLRGETASDALKERIGELAKAQAGSAFVVNGIEVTRDLGARLSPSLEKMSARLREWLSGLPLLVIAVLIVGLFWLLSAVVERMAPVYRRITSNRLLQDLLRQTLRIVVVLVGVFLALEVLDATALVGGVLGTAGVVGLAIGFAFRDIAENYLASIILSVRRPFRGNDLVKIGDHFGTVIRLSASDTVLMAPDGNHLHLPNAMVFKSPIVNFTRNPLRRFDFATSVPAELDLESAQRIGVEILAQMTGVVADPRPTARVETQGDTHVVVRFFGWVDQTAADFAKIHSEAIRIVKGALQAQAQTRRARAARSGGGDGRAHAAPLEEHRAEAQRVDATIEDDVGEQVARDRRTSTERDLLTG